VIAVVKSHFPIDLGVLAAVNQLIPPKSTILELGSGEGTNLLAQQYSVYSVEDDIDWVGYCAESTYIHCPLVEIDYKGSTTSWYDADILAKSLPEDYQLILVDGPSGKSGRSGLLANISLFRYDVPIILDDTIRSDEANIARELAFLLNRPLYTFWNFSIISPVILTNLQISKIQHAALDVLSKEEDKYLLSYFSRCDRTTDFGLSYYHNVIAEEQRLQTELISLKLSKNRLDAIEKSYSLMVGKFLTAPFRLFSLLFKGRG
tara:strand:+ start:478 stop:1263 length:786 start_codon:yes stop_codon:yes gene_type:complete